MSIQYRCEPNISDETGTEVLFILISSRMPGTIDCVIANAGVDTSGALGKDITN